jgi:hypothetical protein
MNYTPVVAPLLARTHAGELRMVSLLGRLASDPNQETEIRHVSRELAQWSQDSVDQLSATAESFGVRLPGDKGPDLRPPGDDDPSSLQDLRIVFLLASDNSLGWEMLAQIAQVAKNPDVLNLAEARHEYNLRQLRWANTMIKTLSPQVLTSR